MRAWHSVSALALIVLTVATGYSPGAERAPTEGGPALSAAAEDAGGEESNWIQLFNGEDLQGWKAKIRGYDFGNNVGDTFRVDKENGVLKVAYDQYDTFDNRFGHLFYQQPFSSYVLRVEYRFVGNQIIGGPSWAVRNSGIMILAQSPETMARDQSFPVSVEVQLLGGTGVGSRPTVNVCTPGTNIVMAGQIAPKHCNASSSKTYHGDQWVTVEVEVHPDGTIKHVIDGQTVLEYSQAQLDEKDDYARKLIAGGDKMLHGGYIALQSESHPVEFRKIELRELGE